MDRTRLLLLSLISLTVLTSGCTDPESTEIITDQNEVSISEDETAELEVWVKNNYDDPASFTLSTDSPDIIDVMDGVSGESKNEYDMGEAGSDSESTKKTLLIEGFPDQLDEQQSEGTFTLELTVDAEAQDEEEELTSNIDVIVFE